MNDEHTGIIVPLRGYSESEANKHTNMFELYRDDHGKCVLNIDIIKIRQILCTEHL